MKKGTLSNGFKFSIKDNSLDDMELLEALAAADKGDVLQFVTVLTKLLGDKQKEKLYESLRDKKTGVVSVTKVGDALLEIIEVAGQEEEEGKNS